MVKVNVGMSGIICSTLVKSPQQCLSLCIYHSSVELARVRRSDALLGRAKSTRDVPDAPRSVL